MTGSRATDHIEKMIALQHVDIKRLTAVQGMLRMYRWAAADRVRITRWKLTLSQALGLAGNIDIFDRMKQGEMQFLGIPIKVIDA